MKYFFSPIFLKQLFLSFQTWVIFSTSFYLSEFSNLTGGKGLILKRENNTFEESSTTAALGQRMILGSCLLTVQFQFVFLFLIGSLVFPLKETTESLNSLNSYLFNKRFLSTCQASGVFHISSFTLHSNPLTYQLCFKTQIKHFLKITRLISGRSNLEAFMLHCFNKTKIS